MTLLERIEQASTGIVVMVLGALNLPYSLPAPPA